MALDPKIFGSTQQLSSSDELQSVLKMLSLNLDNARDAQMYKKLVVFDTISDFKLMGVIAGCTAPPNFKAEEEARKFAKYPVVLCLLFCIVIIPTGVSLAIMMGVNLIILVVLVVGLPTGWLWVLVNIRRAYHIKVIAGARLRMGRQYEKMQQPRSASLDDQTTVTSMTPDARRQGVVCHPGDPNHTITGHFSSVSSVEDEVRTALMADVGEAGTVDPTNQH